MFDFSNKYAILAALVALAAVGPLGCFDELLDDTCETNDDCFASQGEICDTNQGVCVSLVVVNNGQTTNNDDNEIAQVSVCVNATNEAATLVGSTSIEWETCSIRALDVCHSEVVSLNKEITLCASAINHVTCSLKHTFTADQATLSIELEACGDDDDVCRDGAETFSDMCTCRGTEPLCATQE